MIAAMALDRRKNIVLIGMPGVGKSTVGVLLAKETRRQFVDIDVLIQAREGRGLQEIIDADGLDAFCAVERRAVLELEVEGHVIATGGSVIYHENAMAHLAAGGPVVYLRLPLEPLTARIDNLSTRGVVLPPGQDFPRLYAERTPLYEKWANVTVDCLGLNQDQVAAAVAGSLRCG